MDGYVLGPEEGEAIWFIDGLVRLKLPSGAASSDFSLSEFLAPVGSSPPRHTHPEDEAWYVLEGRMRFEVGDRELVANAGSFAFAPRGIPHSFVIEGDAPARVLVLSAPATFADFVREAGEPAGSLTLPEPAEPDFARISDIGARYGIEFVGPPLGATS